MNLLHWIDSELLVVPAIKAVAVICLCCACGLALGKIRLRGIRLGVTFVFFVGLLLGALGISIDHDMLIYAEDFGLIIFVYVLGLQVGPGFMSSFHAGGTRLSLLSLGVIAIGTLFALLPFIIHQMPLGEMMGVLCGATTNTPALAAAQQAFTQTGHPSEGLSSALSLAVTYPIGMVGVIVALILIRIFLAKRHRITAEPINDEAFIASFTVSNPAIFELSIIDCVKRTQSHFVVSRIWRKGRVILPLGDTRLEKGDRLLIISQEKDIEALTTLFGQVDATDWNNKDVDWNKLDSKLVSERILITNSHINGKRLGALHLRNRFGVTVSRVKRSGVHLVATPDLVLRMGDRLTVVGEANSCKLVATELGNRITVLNEPNMVTIFVGMVLGLLLGYIPIAFPGISSPLRLGLAGGPIIMGILIGAFGPRIHMVAYVTTSANLLIRSLGLSTYLACLGLDAGPQFLEVVMRPMALVWIGYSLLIAIIPVLLFAWIAMRWCKCSYATSAGMLCGAMANPIALDYYNTTVSSDNANIAYATVYPLSMFVRVIVAQLIVLFCFS
ncbi:MAG: putative transporter [Alloprevotella sp.]|nr:putative transporter [Alloprevotella sp.]